MHEVLPLWSVPELLLQVVCILRKGGEGRRGGGERRGEGGEGRGGGGRREEGRERGRRGEREGRGGEGKGGERRGEGEKKNQVALPVFMYASIHVYRLNGRSRYIAT